MKSTDTLAREFIAKLDNARQDGAGDIDRALLDYAFEGADYNADSDADIIRNAQRRMESVDCAACAAPGGLIYNADLADKARLWWTEIDEAFADYLDETGENARPHDGPISIGFMVWFAVEWRANSLAGWLTSEIERAEDSADASDDD